MKKKIFLIIASLGAGGSERVFWLLSQYFNKGDYKVTVVLLDGRQQSFPSNIDGVEFIDLKTVKASKSFFVSVIRGCCVWRRLLPYANEIWKNTAENGIGLGVGLFCELRLLLYCTWCFIALVRSFMEIFVMTVSFTASSVRHKIHVLPTCRCI